MVMLVMGFSALVATLLALSRMLRVSWCGPVSSKLTLGTVQVVLVPLLSSVAVSQRGVVVQAVPFQYSRGVVRRRTWTSTRLIPEMSSVAVPVMVVVPVGVVLALAGKVTEPVGSVVSTGAAPSLSAIDQPSALRL